MKSSRRNFNRMLVLGGAAAPLVPKAIAAEDQASSEVVDVRMKVIDAKVSDVRAAQIREFLQKTTAREITVLRAWPVKRDTPPALGLGVFDV